MMTTEVEEKISLSINRLKATTTGIDSTIMPKMKRFRDRFKTSEWQIIEAAINNYKIDLENETRRLEVTKEQLLWQQRPWAETETGHAGMQTARDKPSHVLMYVC